MRRASPLAAALLGSWQLGLRLGFASLCWWFLSALHRTPEFWSIAVVGMAGSVLGFARPSAALYAFTLGVPLIHGLQRLTLLGGGSIIALCFAGLWLGLQVREIVDWAAGRRVATPPPEKSCRHALVVVDLLASAALLSVAWQTWGPGGPGSKETFLTPAVIGFSHPHYFVWSAFLWLQGLFYFKVLIPVLRNEGTSVGYWLRTFFASLLGMLLLALLAQCLLDVPAPPRRFAGMVFELELPYDDSHAYGSVVVACLAFFLALESFGKRGSDLSRAFAVAASAYLSFASWSRVTWLVGFALVLYFVRRRVSRWLMAALALGSAGSVLAFHFAWSEAWLNHPLLYRLGNLVRMDQPRLYLYHKAMGLIESRPFVGHGIGSSYRASVQFADPADPLGQTPDFMHNFLLQIATEQGLLLAALFAGLTGWTLYRGFASVAPAENAPRPVRAAAFALLAYLLTQLTANSLNVYVSNQFFFWFLMTAILIGSPAGEGPTKASPAGSAA